MRTPRSDGLRPPAPGRSDHETRPLITASELAAVLGVTTHTVRHWARTGRIPCLRVGQKTLRFDREAVLAALRGGRVPTGGAA
ncbi:MAG: helix-turn-helix domain-containing protein [Dehalococcoidia bacterium]|nr:helix-turn-helix domain-containing protein [Dehalococcoidia bacterium]